MKQWVVDWPKRDALKKGMVDGIPPLPLKEREVITDMHQFFCNWVLHKQEAIFYSVVFPPDIPMNRNLQLVNLDAFVPPAIPLNLLLNLEEKGMRFKKSKSYGEIKLPDTLKGLGT